MNNPIYKINFFTSLIEDGYDKDSSKVKNAVTKIEKWQGYFEIILKQQNFKTPESGEIVEQHR
jgi:hypothetical protein